MSPQSLTKSKALAASLLAALLSACQPLYLVNLLVPRSGYEIHRGLAYGDDVRQKLDIYVPKGLKGPAPVLLFFYGGAWQAGHRGESAHSSTAPSCSD